MARELGARRLGTATGQCRRLYQLICPSNKVQQLEVPDAHICRFSPCGQYLVCFGGGFTQLVVYLFTGPRVSWQGELAEGELVAMLASFSCFFRLLYRVQLAPAGEVLARDVVLFMAGGSLLLTVSHSPFVMPPPPPAVQPDSGSGVPPLPLPFADSITLHLVRLCDGVRLGGSRLEGELVDLSGQPGSLGVSVHEDLIAVLALRSQAVHLLQVLRGGEEVLHVRSLGPHVQEDDELVLRTAQEAEDRWQAARRAEQEAGLRPQLLLPTGLARLPGGGLAAVDGDDVDGAVPPPLPPLRRSYNGDLVRAAEVPSAAALLQASVAAASSSAALAVPAAAAAGAPVIAVGPSGSAAVPAAVAADPLGHHPPQGHNHPRDAAAPSRASAVLGRTPQGQLPPLAMAPRHGAMGLGHGASGSAGTSGVPNRAGGIGGVSAAAAFDAAAVALAAGGRGAGGSAALMPPPLPLAVLYPPDRTADATDRHASAAGGSGSGGGGGVPGRGPSAGDAAAAEAHQAAVRHQARQRQYEQLAAQGGPSHPPPPAGRSLPGYGHGSGSGSASRHAPVAPGSGTTNANQADGSVAGPGSVPLLLLRHHHYHPQQQQQQPRPTRHQPYQHHQQHPTGAQPHAPHGRHQAAPGAAAYPQHHAQQPHAPGRALLPHDGVGGGGDAGPGPGCVAGITQRLLAHLYMSCCVQPHPHNPKRRQRAAAALFRQLETYRSLFMRKVYLLDRQRLLIDMRKPRGADLGALLGGGPAAPPHGAGPGLPPSQFFLLFDLRTTRVMRFEASPGDGVIESYIREWAAMEPWAESLPAWDRYVYDNIVAAARRKLRAGIAAGAGVPVTGGIGGRTAGPGGGTDVAAAAADRAGCAGKLMQLLPPLSGSTGLCSSPYLDTSLYNYDERVVSPYIRTRPCLEQPVFFRLRNRPYRAAFRLDPGPYEAMLVRERRLARNVTHLFHPDAPFVLAVFGVLQQSTLNINFRL